MDMDGLLLRESGKLLNGLAHAFETIKEGEHNFQVVFGEDRSADHAPTAELTLRVLGTEEYLDAHGLRVTDLFLYLFDKPSQRVEA